MVDTLCILVVRDLKSVRWRHSTAQTEVLARCNLEQRVALFSRARPAFHWAKASRGPNRPVVSAGTATLTEQRLRKLSGEIAWYDEETRKSLGLVLQYRLEIGKRLALAKTLLPHGKFLSWARQEFGWAPRQVQNHLTLAANGEQVSRLSPMTSLRMALAAIKECHWIAVPSTEASPSSAPVEHIHLIGEIEEGELDREGFLAEMSRIAAAYGATRTKWKVR